MTQQTAGLPARSRRVVVAAAVALASVMPLASSSVAGAAETSIGAQRPPRVGTMALAAGGFGLSKGSLDTSLTSLAPTAGGYGSGGGCAGYATSVGVGMYCAAPGGGGGGGPAPPPLNELFPGEPFDPCKVDYVPDGMKPPHNQTPAQGKWYLQACMSGIEWDESLYGQRNLKVTLSFVYVSHSEPDPTQEDDGPLADLLWDWYAKQAQYPIPFVTARPTHIPRVNVPTWFQFRWMDSDGNVTRHPDGGSPNGDPYIELVSGTVELRAQSVEVRVDPQIEGMDTVDCGAVPVPYDNDAPPSFEAQRSKCFTTFEHSSAAAEALTEVDLPPLNPDYPVPMYVLNIEVVWHVEMFDSGMKIEDLGRHTFTAYQQIPVTEAPGYVGTGG